LILKTSIAQCLFKLALQQNLNIMETFDKLKVMDV